MKRWNKTEKAAWTKYKRMYHNAIKGHMYEYTTRLSSSEFRKWYRDAKLAPDSKEHPIRSIIEAQQITENRTFITQVKKDYGGRIPKELREDTQESRTLRRAIISDYVDILRASGMSQEDAREAAMDYYGY